MLAISTDRVDAETLQEPRRWDFRALVRSMLGFGLLSSLFDALTFLMLLGVFHANEAFFQTGWFVKSLLTELVVVAVMRTKKPFIGSLPRRLLIIASMAVAAVAVAIPYSPLALPLGLMPLSVAPLAAIAGIVVAYIGASELLKRRISTWSSPPEPPLYRRSLSLRRPAVDR